MIDRVFTAFFPFCGIGGGALGFKNARVELFGATSTFRVVGGIDFDAGACAAFEMIVGAPALCRDIKHLTRSELLQLCPESPDVVFLSPPCKGASGLLPAEKAKSAKYQAMNRLALDWIELMLATWDAPPRLVLLENVPRLKQMVNGQPLVLPGKSHSTWREWIGNCVPERTARAIGNRMLVALTEAALGVFALSGDLPVWVEPEEARV